MFGIFNKPSGQLAATGELENCIEFLSTDLYSIHFIFDVIERGSQGIINGDISLKECEEFWTDEKNKIMLSRNLRNHKDVDFCRAYILRCFFFICLVYSTPDSTDAIKRMQKILDFLCSSYPPYEKKLYDIIAFVTDEKATREAYKSRQDEEMKKTEKLTAESSVDVFDNAELDDELFYEMVADELENEIIQKGLWAKAFAMQNGDENATKAVYIKMRVEQLMMEESGDRKSSDESSPEPSSWLPEPYIRN